MAERWTQRPQITESEISRDDLVLLADASRAIGDQDVTATVSGLEAFIGQGSVPAAQTAHGFSVGDVITVNSSGDYVEATADLESNAGVVGVVSEVIDVDNFRFKTSGYLSGLSGLTAGEIYYLQDAGGLGSSEGTVTRPILVALSATEGMILTIGSGGGGSSGSSGSTVARSFVVAASDETSDLTTGANKFLFRMPFAFLIQEVRASLTTAPVGSAVEVDVQKNGITIFSTPLTVDDGEKTSVTAATPAVISDAAVANDDEISIDIDQIGSTTAGAGLKVTIIGQPAAGKDALLSAVGDQGSDITTGTGKLTFRVPYDFTLEEIRASVDVAPVGADLQVDVNVNGTSILSTKLTIDDGEKTSVTAAVAAVISSANLSDDDEVTIDVDQVGSSVAGQGLKVALIGQVA